MEGTGAKFIHKLQQINISEVNQIEASSIEWLFITPDSSPLTEFVEWFCNNIRKSDVLSEEEIQL